MLFSKTTNGFYDESINENMPADVVEVSDDEYKYLLSGQSQGKIISSDQQGRPVLVDPPKPSAQENIDACKSFAKMKLQETDWSQQQDVSETLLNKDEFISYRAVVRNLAINPIPNPVWPDQPLAKWKE